MTGWQIAMNQARGVPPIAPPVCEVEAPKLPPHTPKAQVSGDEFRAMQDLSKLGWSAKRIGLALGRGEKTVRLYLNGTRVADE